MAASDCRSARGCVSTRPVGGACVRRRRGCRLWRGRSPGRAPSSPKPTRHGSASRRCPRFRPRPRRFESGQNDPNAQMLVRADELQYDNANNRILAIGNVQIYYQALHARGRPGHLRADHQAHARRRQCAPHRSRRQGGARRDHRSDRPVPRRLRRLAAARGRRQDALRGARAPSAQGGRYTVFQSGVYTACEPCKDDPRKPPRWQVRATRIIHDDTEKMIYFEDARLEFLGFPMFYWPYLSTPDPTVKRKTGVLDAEVRFTRATTAFSARRCRISGRSRRTTTSR